MVPQLIFTHTTDYKVDTVLLLDNANAANQFCNERELAYLQKQIGEGSKLTHINQYDRQLFIVVPDPKKTGDARREALRKTGHELYGLLKKQSVETLQIVSELAGAGELLALAEGVVLSSYSFQKYKSEKKGSKLTAIHLQAKELTETAVKELEQVLEGTFLARDLVNEPVIYLTAEQLSKEITELGRKAGFKVDVFGKTKIRSLKMGGLLAVNMGAPNPPTFNILEYKPDNAVNDQPYVLVGKGVVYDTGGLSLKPTPNSMDEMKCDMAGAAAVVGALYAVARNKLPLYVVGLIPATENRPDGNAITPGDVITMYSGKTVEVLNTDAEGRLILADALCYATKYKPALVIDLATLTGSAARAIGKEGIVYMGTAPEAEKKALEKSGYSVHERLVEFPLWEEYDSHLESSIADLKNIGGAEAGAITAGKFLEHFVEYPWLHLDIAAGAFLSGMDSYRGKNGTGIGVRLLYHFLKEKLNNPA
jgi:leucyl aminopeptidase